MVTPEKEYFTQQKFDELSAELGRLKAVVRKEVAEELAYAKSLGDLSENAEYHEAREKQSKTEARIAGLENMLKNAEIVKRSLKNNVVSVGSNVVVRRGSDMTEINYTIVGSEEADMASGKLSLHSPLGSSMLGRKKNESFSFSTPRGKMNYTIVDIK